MATNRVITHGLPCKRCGKNPIDSQYGRFCPDCRGKNAGLGRTQNYESKFWSDDAVDVEDAKALWLRQAYAILLDPHTTHSQRNEIGRILTRLEVKGSGKGLAEVRELMQKAVGQE